MTPEDQKLLEEITGLRNQPNPKPYLNNAVGRNPEQEAINVRLSDKFKLPVDTVERNRDELLKTETLQNIDLSNSPVTSAFLTDDKNSRVAINDVDNLKQIELLLNQPAEEFRSVGDFATDTLTDIAQGVVGLGESFVGMSDLATGNMMGNALSYIGYDPKATKRMMDEWYSDARKRSAKEVSDATGFIDTAAALVENPDQVFGTIVQSLPMMLGSIGAARAVAANILSKAGVTAGTAEATALLSQPQNVALISSAAAGSEGGMAAGSIQEGARQEGRSWYQSVIPALMGGFTTALITKGVNRFFPDVETQAATGQLFTNLGVSAKNIGIGTVREGVLEEAPQSAQEQVFTNIAQGESDWFKGVGAATAQGMFAGAGTGLGLGTINQINAVRKPINDNLNQTVTSVSEQAILSNLITLFQENNMNGLAQDRFADFLRANKSPREVHVTPEGIQAVFEAGMELPFTVDDPSLDTTMDIETFATKVANNEQLMEILRPHLRLSSESLTINEMENHELDLKELLQRAERDTETQKEIDELFDRIVDELLATRRMTQGEARLNALLLTSYAATKSERLGIPIQQVINEMNVRVEGANGQPGEGKTLEQRTDDPQGFTENVREALAANPKGGAADVLSPEDYANMKLFTYDNGKAGFAITPDGMLVSVFKHPDSSIRGFIDIATQDAIKNGATKLEAFEGTLTEGYGRNGFVEVSRVPWNEEYRPETWTDDMGTPDLVYMELQNEYQQTVPETLQDVQGVRGSTGEVRGRDGEAGVQQTSEQTSTGREEDGSLRGLPRQVGSFEASAWQPAIDAANKYAESAGIEYNPPATYTVVDEERAKRIADAFEQGVHDPENPEVKAAYQAMIDETLAQYEVILETGLTVEFIEGDDPYEDSPRMMTDDVRNNNHMWVFPTDDGFGSSDLDVSDNPLLQETKYTDANGKPMLANDVFRVVHDYFGHVKEGVGFRANGEENAWRAHSAMYSPLARRALTTETRGQNSWVNYGKYGEFNRTASAKDTKYADQKVMLMPDWVVNEGAGDPKPKTFNQSQPKPQRNSIGLYSAVEKAALSLNIPGWKSVSKKERAAVEDSNRRAQAEVDQLSRIWNEEREKLRKLSERVDLAESIGLTEEANDLADQEVALERSVRNLNFRIIDARKKIKDVDSLVPRASGREIWQKLSKEPGVKKEELEWLGLEQFLLSSMDKLSREDVVVFIRENGVKIEEVVADEEGDGDSQIEFANGEADYDESNWEYRVEDITYDPPDWMRETALAAIAEQEESYIEANKEEDESDEEFIEREFSDELNDKIEELARESAQEEYEENPIMLYEFETPNGITYELRGNDDVGYTLIRNYDVIDSEIWSINEAEIQATDYARDYGDTVSEDDPTIAKWEDYVTEGSYDNYRELKLTLPEIEDDYYNEVHFDDRNIVAFLRVTDRQLKTSVDPMPDDREVEYEIDSRPNTGDFGKTVAIIRDKYTEQEIWSAALLEGVSIEQFTDNFKKMLGDDFGKDTEFGRGYYLKDGKMYRKADAEFTPEKDTYFVDEMQSDWHQQGRKEGYQQGLSSNDMQQMREQANEIVGQYESEANDKVRQVADTVGLKYIGDGSYEPKEGGEEYSEFEISQMLSELARNGFKHSYPDEVGARYDKVVEIATEIAKTDKDWVYSIRDRMREVDNINSQLQAERHGVPNAPFKGNAWLELGLKTALVDAVNSGSKAFAWADANVLSHRWSESYRELYENQYDGKMVSMVKKLTKQQPRHLNLDGEEHQHQELGYWVIDITPELKEQIESQSFSLFQNQQQQQDQRRGSITFMPDGEAVVRLFNSADLSTFIHESGHLFLEMEARFAEKYGITEDQLKILNWLGVESFDDIEVEHHEKWARGFEAYAMEGKAPSLSLRRAFSEFRNWLTRIYKDLRGLDVELTDDIRGVMDRMLATDQAIADATATPLHQELFRSKEQAGMTDDEWEDYQNKLRSRDDKAKQTLTEKLLAEWKRRRTAEWKEEKKPLIDQAMEELRKQPVYQIMSDLKEAPMDADMLKEAAGVEKLPGKFGFGKTVKDGVDPAEYAELYGYNSVAQMYNAIVSAKPLKQAAEEQAEAQMIGKYGDILNDGTVEREAMEAVQNEEQAGLLLMELNALKPKNSPKINSELIRQDAKRTIGSMTFGQIKPNKHYRAMLRAAENAAKATDPQEKFKFKYQQMVNHYMYREAVATRQQMEKDRKYIRGVQQRQYSTKHVAEDYINQMKIIASMYEMRKNPQRVTSVNEFLNWFEVQVNDENVFTKVQLLDEVLVQAYAFRKDGNKDIGVELNIPMFDELTAEQIRSTRKMLEHLRHVGGQMADEAKAEQQAKIDELEQEILKRGGKDVKDVPGLKDDATERRRSFSHMMNMLPSLRNLIRKLDGFKSDVAQNLIYLPLQQANDAKIKLAGEMYERFETELKDVHKLGVNNKNKIDYVLESGTTITLSSEHRFMVALYWGTESSRQAIRDGYGMTDKDVMTILSDLTPEQLQMVNNVWKVNESMWGDLSKASIAMTGVAPIKLEPTPYTVNGVELTGGHMRLFYDSTDIEAKTEVDEATKFASIIPSKAGSLYERVGSGGRPPLLDRNNIARAIGDNVHYIAFADVGRQMASILNNKKIQAAIEKKHGRGFKKALIENVTNLTTNAPTRETIKWFAGLMRLMRQAATFKHLAYSIRNSVQQFTSLPIVAQEVGTAAFTAASGKFMSDRENMVNFVDERSSFMKNRASVVNREAAEYLRKMEISGQAGHMWEVFKRHGFTMQTAIDSLMAYPTWLAKYEQSMEAHGDETRAASEADSAVAESVGSGSDLHLGSIFHQNQSELIKTLTVFGSWFNAYYQRVYRGTEGFSTMTMDGLLSLTLTPIMAGLMAALLVMDYPDEEDDMEDWLAWGGKHWGSFIAGMFPIARDMYSAFTGYTPKPLLTTGQEAPSRLLGEINAGLEGRQSWLKTGGDVGKLATTFVPVPGSGTVFRAVDFVDSNMQGNESGNAFKKTYQALVEGANRNK